MTFTETEDEDLAKTYDEAADSFGRTCMSKGIEAAVAEALGLASLS